MVTQATAANSLQPAARAASSRDPAAVFLDLLAVFAAGAGARWLVRRQLGIRRAGRAAMALGLLGAAGLVPGRGARRHHRGGPVRRRLVRCPLGNVVAVGKPEPEGANLAGLVVYGSSWPAC
ncbi:hypothetical protein [Amycolatopsis sp. lyj-23]|uniref:hypothetical protein n=1 Tax=Amycolatopsis sp. lyj-23 TaxID=2789283 RepID=UPI00397A199F